MSPRDASGRAICLASPPEAFTRYSPPDVGMKTTTPARPLRPADRSVGQDTRRTARDIDPLEFAAGEKAHRLAVRRPERQQRAFRSVEFAHCRRVERSDPEGRLPAGIPRFECDACRVRRNLRLGSDPDVLLGGRIDSDQWVRGAGSTARVKNTTPVTIVAAAAII